MCAHLLAVLLSKAVGHWGLPFSFDRRHWSAGREATTPSCPIRRQGKSGTRRDAPRSRVSPSPSAAVPIEPAGRAQAASSRARLQRPWGIRPPPRVMAARCSGNACRCCPEPAGSAPTTRRRTRVGRSAGASRRPGGGERRGRRHRRLPCSAPWCPAAHQPAGLPGSALPQEGLCGHEH